MPDPDELPATRGNALALALDAYEGLARVAEAVADEWTYVSRLAEAGRARLARATGPQPGILLARAGAAAVATAAAEARRIADPHRAIDWLSTFPAVVELAMGGGFGSGRSPSAGGADAARTAGPGTTGTADRAPGA